MRLYRLLRRNGQVKARPWPWFEAPAAGAPVRYDGWLWDPKLREWVETDVAEIIVELKVPKYPEPTEPPVKATPDHVPGWDWSFGTQSWEEVPLTRKEVTEGISPSTIPTYVPTMGTPFDVEGWSWSERTEEWVATIVTGERIGFTPPRSLPPNIDLATVNLVFPATEQYQLFYNNLIGMGLTPTDADRIGRSMVDGFWNMSRSALTKDRAAEYAKSFQFAQVALSNKIETVGAYGAVIIFFTGVGLAIGTILERFTFVDTPVFVQSEPLGTYLMGPEEWFYSRNIGVSPQGNLYYSKCQGIGTEYVRHKRGAWGSLYDTIDFPGGFVEEGYQFPYWVKYTWSHWDIVYIGMMFSSSEMVYALKKEFISLEERARRVTVRPSTEWCSGFHWYL